MSVAGFSLFLVKWPFRLAVAHSLASHRGSANLVLKIVDAQGRSGWGEGVPRAFVTGESLEASLDFLRREALLRLPGADLDSLPPLGMLAALLSPQEMDLFPAAACALETALLDLRGRREGRPLSDYLGGQARDRLTYSGVLPLVPLDGMPALLQVAKALELSQIKIKVDGRDDLPRVEMVRKNLGPEAALRVDANGAWTRQQAREIIPDLEALGVSEVEQPLPAVDQEGMLALAAQVNSLIIADESLCTPAQARDLAASGARLGFNLRLSKCGGFARTLGMLERARAGGLPCQLGCQVGELGILSAAGRHLAAAAPDLTHLEGSFTRFLMDRDLTDQDLSPGLGGQAPALGGPGLGLEVQESSLAQSLIFSHLT